MNGLQKKIVDCPPNNMRGEDISKSSGANGYVSSVWSFPGSAEQLYRWYGTLPAPLVQRIVALYAKKDFPVLDPFMGTGTTLVTASSMGYKSLGIDTNPLSCLIAKARTSAIPSIGPTIKLANNVASRCSLLNNMSSERKKWLDHVADDKFAYMRKWFREDTLTALIRLFANIADVDDEDAQRVMYIAASQVTRDVANVDPRCTHHLVTKRKDYIDPVGPWVQKVAEIVETLSREPFHSAPVDIKQGSAIDEDIGNEKIGLAIVHPPYLGMIHYYLIHRLATDLLDSTNELKSPSSLSGLNFDNTYLKKMDASTDNSEDYTRFVSQLASRMAELIAPDGRCVVIIGDQRYEGHIRHPFTDFISSFEDRGFLLEENFIWILQNNAGMHILRRGHFIDHNYILVLHRKRAGEKNATKATNGRNILS